MRELVKNDAQGPWTPNTPNQAHAYPEDLDTLASGMSDEQALKKIGQRSSTGGKIVTAAIVLGIGGLVASYIQSSANYDARMNGIEAAGELEGDAMLASLRGELEGSEYDDVRVRAIRNLAHFKDQGSVPAMITALETPGVVRRAAALGLARIGSPAADAAKPALMKALPETDARDRPQVVWALAVLKEQAATDAILDEFTKGLLQGQPDFDPKVITEALGIAKLSSPELTGHEKKPVRTLVAVALAEAASPEVVEPLMRMIGTPDEDTEVVRAAVSGLGRAADPRAAGAMFKLMVDRPAMRQSVLDALARSTAAPQLAILLKSAKDATNKRDLARLLHETHDPRAADALAALIEDPDEDTRIEATEALADLGDKRAVEPLLVLAKSDNDSTGSDAINHLRTLGVPEAGEALLGMFDEFPARKASIMRALGASGAQAAGPLLLKELSGDDIGSAAKALGQLRYEKAYPVFVKMLKRDPKIDFSRPGIPTEMAYRNRYEAMQGLRYFGHVEGKLEKEHAKCVEALKIIVEDPEDDPRLSAVAGATLGEIADDAVYEAMLAKILDPAVEERIRANYVQGLWRRPNPAVAAKLMPLFKPDTPGTIKTAAALAIGYAGNPANDAGLLQLLDSPTERRYAAIAVALGGSPEAATKMLEVLPTDRDAEEVLRLSVNSNEDDNFNLLMAPMFESGQIFRRMKASKVLKTGNEKISYGYIWTHLATRLGSGWSGPGGISSREIRDFFMKTLKGPDAEHRALAAAMLASMNMRGLLLAARDAGVEEARMLLLSLDRPKQDAT